MRYLIPSILVTLLSLFNPPAQADESQVWLQTVMYVKHYDQDAWDWVEGFDNKALGLEYRNGQHGVGIETFINSFGDRSNGVHYTNTHYFDSGLSIGASAGINHGYEDEYYSRRSSVPDPGGLQR